MAHRISRHRSGQMLCLEGSRMLTMDGVIERSTASKTPCVCRGSLHNTSSG